MKKLNLFLIVLFGICFFIFINKANAYTPPIGIPDPGMWGTTHPIDSAAPNTAVKCPTWPSASTVNCYYIDNTHPQATDTSNPYGYPDKPRARIPEITYLAGSYVEIHGGPYVETNINITFNGTADNPIWFRGTPTSAPVLTGNIYITDSSYVFIEHLDFNGGENLCLKYSGMDSHHIVFRNSFVRNRTQTIFPATAGISITPTQAGNIHDLVFYNNYFGDLGDYTATEDYDFHGINPTLWGRHPPTTLSSIWVLNNTGYHLSGNLVQFNGDQRDAMTADNEIPIRLISNTNLQNSHHFYVGKNVHHHNRQDLVGQKFSTDIIISQNYAYDNYNGAVGGGSGGVYQEGARYVWYLFNKFHNQDTGIRQSNTNFSAPNMAIALGMRAEKYADLRMYAIGNVITLSHNTADNSYYSDTHRDNPFQTATAFLAQRGFYTRYVIDNTIHNTGGGFYFANSDSSTYLSGNVIAGVQGIDTEGLPMYHGGFFQAGNDMAMDYSFFEPRTDDGTVRFCWFSPNIVRTTTLSSFKSSTGECANCYEGNPMFIDPENYNLRPQENSPLIGKGIRHSVYDEFEARYGINIAYDFDGNPRPAGSWTIGAFEYNAGDLIAPSAPSGLNVL